MRILAALAVALALPGAAPVQALDNRTVERLALCQDSWFEWKTGNPALLQRYAADIRSDYPPSNNEAYFVPRTSLTLLGYPVLQVYPQSVGMGVGFSAMVGAGFAAAKASVERKIGRPLKCQAGDNMHGCELPIADKRSLTVAADDNRPTATLIGCYYFYEK